MPESGQRGVRSAAGVLVAALAAAGSTFLITVIAARALTKGSDASAYSEFVVFWSLLFWCYGIVVGIQQEATRSVSAARVHDRPAGVGALRVAMVLGGLVAVCLAVASPLWARQVLPLSTWVGAVAVVVGTLLYALYAGAVGTAAGLEDWHAYSGLMIVDAVARLGLVAVAALLGSGLWGIEVGSVAASAVCLGVLMLPRLRSVRGGRTDRDFGSALRGGGYAMASSTASAVLVVGFPVLVSLLVRDPDPAQLAATLTVVQLTRAPIMMPLLAFQSVAVAAFVAKRGAGFRDLLKPVALVAAVGLVGMPLAAWLGPALLRLLYGPVYVVSAWTFGVLVLAAVAMALLTLTGTLALALESHRGYMLGWLSAAAAAVLLLRVPTSLSVAVSLALGLAPFAGVVVHVTAVVGRLKRPAERSAPVSGAR